MLILQCILGLHIQSVDFTNAFAQAYIPSGKPVFIELPRDFKSDGGQYDVVLKLKKSLYVQAEAARIWYEKFRNGLLESDFVISKVDPCLFMYKTVICVVYVNDFLFWELSQSDIDNVMKPLKEYGSSYNWEQSKEESVSEFLCIYINPLYDSGFQFFKLD